MNGVIVSFLLAIVASFSEIPRSRSASACVNNIFNNDEYDINNYFKEYNKKNKPERECTILLMHRLH